MAPAADSSSSTDPALRWPTPPFIGYGAAPLPSPQPCEIEGVNGQVRACQLVAWEPEQGQARIQVPPSKAVLPLRLDMFRRLTLTTPLAPDDVRDLPSDGPLQALMEHRPRLPYHLELVDGSRRDGHTVGYVETDVGVYLFEPLDELGRVRRVFVPRSAYFKLQVGEAIGHVLVEQHALSPEQVELAAREQAAMRQRKLGDYLVVKEIIKPEQLLQALEEQQRMPLVRIGEALTALGFITPAQLDEALQRQRQERSMPLGELLVQSGQITREQLRVALARKMGYPVVDLKQFPIDPEALRRVPLATARKLRIVPLLWQHGTLIIAAEDPSQRAVIDELEFSLQCKVVPTLASAPLDSAAVGEAYARFGMDSAAATAPARADEPPLSAEALLESLQADAQGDDEPQAAVEQSDNSLVRLINSIIIEAHQQGASDIHIETYPDKRKVRIRLRKDGRLRPYMELPHTYRAALVARLKIMCDLDIAERRKPQDGKIDFARFSPQHRIELRVATIPTYGGAEDVVLRILASARAMSIDELGLSAPNRQALLAAAQRPHGMLLCVGPTGSGKTTTLHALLQHLNTPDRKIWTAEDPIEITHPDLRQVQVNPKIDWTFDKALRAFLRADPDVIMVGEIRDSETARMAIEASLTGHLVLSTLHTNSAPETVVRLLDMGMDPFNFADSLVLVLAQRLVRRLCRQCVRLAPPSEAELEELIEDYRHAFPEAVRPTAEAVRAEWAALLPPSSWQVGHPVGCAACDQTGFKGRVGVHELLSIDATLRRLIQTKAPAETLQQTAMAGSPFRTLRQDGILKVLQGLTTLEEVRAGTASS
ncbi:Type II secretion system protein E [Tepidimonas alkaliphilus]|uniref:Type II secretion system protein E n=1 Tax=Tepidimonas alkaliphilus TaxID=2588942 RepID=A0A554W5F7_9BURK|nr:ATPase, T2SS/T4P/T4SS family [Tepidimonas alkaliphilus]TSE18817.1 Type II secretion system protein E [Tepidimonas alkaliphilus]